MKFYFVLISLTCSSYCIAASNVQLAPNSSAHSTQINPVAMQVKAVKKKNETLSGSVSLGLLGAGKGEEMVWQEGRKLSHLNWQLKTTPIIQAAMSWQLGPRLQLDVRGWHNLSDRSSFMEDFDWANPQQPQLITHTSSHPNTRLKAASLLDVGMGVALMPAYEPFQLKLLLGIQQQQMKWKAKGGSFKYPNSQGVFGANTPVVDYQQRFITPYIGVYTHYEFPQLRFGAAFKYSAWVKGQDQDLHHLRQIKFKSTTENSQFYNLGVKASYLTQKNTDFFAAIDWTHYKTAQTPQIQSINRVFGRNGLSNQYSVLTIGVDYHF